MWHIAVDIGASSGRVIAGRLAEGEGGGSGKRLDAFEIHRFPNPMIARGSSLFWDVDHLFKNVLEGLKKARARGIERASLGIDTWGVDYVLVDEGGERLGEAYCYRDARCAPAMEALLARYPKRRLYERTGIQFLPFNTIYQLAAHDENQRKRASRVLLVPDYLSYRLTGTMVNEATNASTTQLADHDTRDFDHELLWLVGLRRDQFARVVEPGASLGPLKGELSRLGVFPECEVYAVASHDTASAVLGTPLASSDEAYLSAGTWSLMGLELDSPIIDENALERNFTNEFGAGRSYRFLKNLNGLWLLQGIVASFGLDDRGDAAIAEARGLKPFERVIDVCAEDFLHPGDMASAIAGYCERSGHDAPSSPAGFVRAAIDGMALAYRSTLDELREATGKDIRRVRIVGGGTNIPSLCQRAADAMGVELAAGPVEATALGNLAMQLIATGEIEGIEEARRVIGSYSGERRFTPSRTEALVEGALARLAKARERMSPK
jgi:rhamnulokinase